MGNVLMDALVMKKLLELVVNDLEKLVMHHACQDTFCPQDEYGYTVTLTDIFPKDLSNSSGEGKSKERCLVGIR